MKTSERGERPTRELYALQHLAPEASDEEVRKAYRQWAQIYHPDKHLSVQAVAHELPEAADIAQKDPKFSEPTNSWPGGLPCLEGSKYGAGEDVRILATSAKMRSRMPIEGHVDVPPGEGTILVPFKALSEDCYSAPNVESLLSMDRPFIFPGERFHIVVHVSVHHPETTCAVTPYKVAAAIQNLSHAADFGCSSSQHSMDSSHDTDEGNSRKSKTTSSAGNALKGKWFNTTGGGNLVATTEWVEIGNSGLLSESRKRRTEMLLESFKSSHFHVKIGRKGHSICVPQVVESGPNSLLHDEGCDGENTAAARGCRTVLTEDGAFESTRAGGVARAATSCWSLGNGDVVVLLQVTMASEIPFRNAEVEVLQFEPYVVPPVYSEDNSSLQLSKNRTEYLLQWLLPLDRPSSPPPPLVATLSQPTLQPSPSGRLSFSGAGNTNFFSFSHVRNSSVGSTPTSVPTPVVLCSPPPIPSYGPEEWGRFSSEIVSHGDVGSEGLLSFRGTALEPQRFSAHCGLPGSYVPGKRWKRTLAIVQPVRLESYFTDCNTQDLICVLIENILPPAEETADVVIFIDSVSIVCQSASPGSSPLPIPVACVEVGEDHTLPNLALRPGEQHSLILRPISQVWKHSIMGDTGPQNQLFQDVQKPGRFPMRTFDDQELDSSAYAILVSCHCTHTESRLHFKHSLSWCPRPLRDLLLSVALENSSPVKLPNEALPQLTPQVVSVQATNLTSQDMHLTLLAPSSLATSPLSVMPFPTNGTVVNMVNKSYQSLTPREVSAWEDSLTKPITDMSSGRLSLPPVQPMEMVLGVKPTVLKERIFPASSGLLDSVAARTHLWLQSTVPLGRLPPHATIAVRCLLLPLTSGIITLDTLHIATHEHDAVYEPENSLQIYCMSSVASDIT